MEKRISDLTKIVRLIEEMTEQSDFLGKDDVTNHLRWAAKAIAEDIWINRNEYKENN
jgi:hypothetical protein